MRLDSNLHHFNNASRVRYVQLWHHHDSRFSWSPKEVFSWQEVDNWKVAYLTTLAASTLLWIRCIYRAVVCHVCISAIVFVR